MDGEDNSSIRIFRNARLQKKANLRNRKPKLGDLSEGLGSISAVVKEGTMQGLLVENIPKTGAYSAREENLKREV